MNDKYRKQFAAITFAILLTAFLAACSDNKAKIIGIWTKQNAEVSTTVTFTEDGTFNFKLEKNVGTKSSVSVSSGKYEVNGDNLRLFDPPSKNSKETNIKIIKLDDKSMILESEVRGEKVQETYAK
jgi:uncharacterized protein (TIGR03066 family)